MLNDMDLEKVCGGKSAFNEIKSNALVTLSNANNAIASFGSAVHTLEGKVGSLLDKGHELLK